MMKKLLRAVASAWGQRITLLVLICIVMAIAQPVFFRPANATSVLQAIAAIGIMVSGMLLTVLVGGMDLSVGSMAGLSASTVFVVARIYDFSNSGFLLGCAVALALCLVVGYINGFVVTKFGVPAFVVTLAMRYILYGSIPFLTSGNYIINPKQGMIHQIGNMLVFQINFGGGETLRVTMPIVILIVVVAVIAFVLGITTFGRQLYAIGGNKNVANLAGISSNRKIRYAFMISSVTAGLGGVMLASMNGQAGQPTGLGYEGNVLMAMVVGGINLAGGEGGISGAVFGALLVGIINNVMLMLSVSSDIQQFVRGAIILAAMTLNMYTKRGSAGIIGTSTSISK